MWDVVYTRGPRRRCPLVYIRIHIEHILRLWLSSPGSVANTKFRRQRDSDG